MTVAAKDDRRRWFAFKPPEDLHPSQGEEVCDAVLDVLGDLVGYAEVDAYSDYEAELGPDALVAQAALRSVEAGPGRMGDPFMAVGLDLRDPAQRSWLRAFGAWSINADLWAEPHHLELGCFHDSSWSITVRLTDSEVVSLNESLSHLGRFELLRDLRRDRRRRRRQTVLVAVRRVLRGLGRR